jgi:hypothetical protein
LVDRLLRFAKISSATQAAQMTRIEATQSEVGALLTPAAGCPK